LYFPTFQKIAIFSKLREVLNDKRHIAGELNLKQHHCENLKHQNIVSFGKVFNLYAQPINWIISSSLAVSIE
jgi:hypothetical protein